MELVGKIITKVALQDVWYFGVAYSLKDAALELARGELKLRERASLAKKNNTQEAQKETLLNTPRLLFWQSQTLIVMGKEYVRELWALAEREITLTHPAQNSAQFCSNDVAPFGRNSTKHSILLPCPLKSSCNIYQYATPQSYWLALHAIQTCERVLQIWKCLLSQKRAEKP